jgi:hypothetical protein
VPLNAASRTLLARALSILGHPAVVLPATAVVAFVARPQSTTAVIIAALVVSALITMIMGYACIQVGRGRWTHVDAIQPSERRDWNRVSGLALGAGAIFSILGGDLILALGLASATAVVALSALASPRLKLSQHVAFLVLATAIAVWINPWMALAGVMLTVAVGWSRLELGRHTRAEVGAGAVAGFVAATLFLIARPLLSADFG